MRIDAIPAWIYSVDPSSQFVDTHEQITSLKTAKRRFSGYAIGSPSIRKRREQPEAEAPFNADKTPQSSTTRPPNSIFDHPPLSFDVTGSTIDSFPRTLAAHRHSQTHRNPSVNNPGLANDLINLDKTVPLAETKRSLAKPTFQRFQFIKSQANLNRETAIWPVCSICVRSAPRVAVMFTE
ncbi:hypothetical protein FOVSG1_002050 [Fusarium oxysporum f. sp. vasinfectum]